MGVPFPLTLTLSPRRGNSKRRLSSIPEPLVGPTDRRIPPLLGERAGVRGNLTALPQINLGKGGLRHLRCMLSK